MAQETDYTAIAKELYPDMEDWGQKDGSFYGPGDYSPIVEYIGKVCFEVSDGDYQGDTRVLYEREDGMFGWLNFGWGSCSGCDALQACGSYESIGTLIKGLVQDVRWDTREGLLEFFKTHDWEGDYS